MPPIKLGDLLLKAKAISDSQLKAALTEQSKWGGKLGEILVRMNVLTEEMLVKALSKQLALPSVNLDSIQGIAPHVRSRIPAQTAKDMTVLPLQLRDEGKTLVVAMAEPQNIHHVDTLRSLTRCRIMVQVAGRTQIARAYGRFYEGEADGSDLEGSFKFVDAQGNTVIRSAVAREPAAPEAKRARQSGEVSPRAVSMSDVPAGPSASLAPSRQLEQIEEAQRREVAVLKSMVELLIEKGIFTRDEYLARVKR